MDTISKRAEMIDSTSWGSGFNWSQLTELAIYMEYFEVMKGEILLREGEKSRYLTLVVEGVLAVNKGETTDISQRIAVVNQGGTFGEMSLFDNEPRSATVVAATDAKLLIMNEKDFNSMVNKTPALAILFVMKIAKLLSQRLRRTSGRLVDFQTP